MKKWDPKYDEEGWAADNYWAGAKKACEDIGMSLLDETTLLWLSRKTTAEKEQLGLPTDGWFWSSSEGYPTGAYSVNFNDGRTDDDFKGSSTTKVLCVGD